MKISFVFQGSLSLSQIFSNIGHRVSSSNNSSEEEYARKLSENFHSYLKDARKSVRSKFQACQVWQYEYDGLNPPSDALDIMSDKRLSSEDTNQDSDLEDQSNCEGPLEGQPISDYGPLHSTIAPQSSGYTSLTQMSSSPSAISGPVSMTAEEDQEFWKLMKDPTVSEMRINKVITKMQNHDELSLSSGGNLSTGYNEEPDRILSEIGGGGEVARRQLLRRKSSAARREDVDFTITSLGKKYLVTNLTSLVILETHQAPCKLLLF